jgi:hypothetical protein
VNWANWWENETILEGLMVRSEDFFRRLSGVDKVESASVGERRAPVQAERDPLHREDRARDKPYGSVKWEEHLAAWTQYALRFGSSQSAGRIAERGGFGYYELTALLGHEPKTWQPR